MANNQLVSVVIPTYNRAEKVLKAIKSVQDQTYKDWEIILVDDGSADNTKEQVIALRDKRVRYFYQRNQGPAATRNLGLKKAEGKLIAYLDSDNTWYSEFLEVMTQALVEHPDKVLVYCGRNYRRFMKKQGKLKVEKMRIEGRPFNLQRLWQMDFIIDTSTIMHRREILKQVKGWDLKVRFLEDWDFVARISKYYPYGLLFVERVLTNYDCYLVKGAKTISATADYRKMKNYLWKKYQKEPLFIGNTKLLKLRNLLQE